MIMNIIKNFNENELTIVIEGRIDTITSEDLKKEIDEEINNIDTLTLDFEKVKYISSAGLRVLVSTQKKLKAANKHFVIKNVDDEVNEIFRMSGFNKVLTIE
jgi:anti-anti-sigma factor